MHPDRLFSPDPVTHVVARELYESIALLPLVCPHSHVDARLFSNPAASFGSLGGPVYRPGPLHYPHIVFPGHFAQLFGRPIHNLSP